MTQTSLQKTEKVTIITVTNYKYSFNTTKPKLKNDLKKLFPGARYISST